jgi:hypothetical protein
MASTAAIAALALVFFVLLCVRDGGGVDAADTLSQGQSLGANDMLVSANGTFKVGFFTPAGGDPGKVYLGVMYATSNVQTVMWVANRDAPVRTAAGAASATVTGSGELLVKEGDRVAWRTNASAAGRSKHTLTIRDDGNLVISGSDAAGTDVEWESFHHPTDTFVPGMEIALRQTNGDRTLYTSWRSDADPATGDFTLGLDASAQLYIWRSQGGKNSTYWRSGQWASGNFVGIPWRALYVYGFKLNGDPPPIAGDMSIAFTPFNSSLYRFVLRPNGVETCYMLLGSGDWELVWSQPTIPCHRYNLCGDNAECTADDNEPICTCFTGN